MAECLGADARAPRELTDRVHGTSLNLPHGAKSISGRSAAIQARHAVHEYGEDGDEEQFGEARPDQESVQRRIRFVCRLRPVRSNDRRLIGKEEPMAAVR